MKCPAVACLWPPSPPSHRISAAAVLFHNPPCLFTGGADGAIVRWTLSGHDVRPLALLCGHSAKIAALAPCFPDAIQQFSSNSICSNSTPASLLSACENGVLCVWSAGSFRCRRRRRLPSWAGIPSHLAEHPSSPHHICIACSYGESSNTSVLIVDSGTLLIVQTVFHGSLGIGSVKFMAIVPSLEETDKDMQAVFVVDGNGKTQFLPLSKDYAGRDYECSTSANRVSSSDSLAGESSSNNGGLQAAAIARDGNLLALIYEFHCEFRSISNGAAMGEISLPCTNLGDEGSFKISGGMFLHHIDFGNASNIHICAEDFKRSFALWYSNGSATVYIISILDSSVNCEPHCEVPAVSLRSGGGSLFHLCQLNDCLLRLESTPFSMGDLLTWKPSITIWSMAEARMSRESVPGKCSSSVILGEGGFSGIRFNPTQKVDRRLEERHQNEILDSNLGIIASRKTDSGFNFENPIISCSMVFSGELYYPQYAVVYGFYSGEIKVTHLQSPSLNSNSMEEDSLHHSKLNASGCFFSGHTGAVLCLAVHRMDASSRNLRIQRILLSGSMDCTVRLWDFDSGSLMLVMHHHMAPVKQIILPSTLTERPWYDCFLSVGEDGCVALVSLETLRVERMFCGHPSYPSAVAWDSRRGYLACLCQCMSTPSDTVSTLYLWDVKTGARERIIRGSASRSMLDHFCSCINQSILGEATSSSPLILPIVDDSGFSQSKQTKTDVGTVSVSSGDMLKSSRKGTDFVESSIYFTNSNKGKLASMSMINDANSNLVVNNSTKHTGFQHVGQSKKHPIICSCPFPGIVSLEFDLSTLVSLQHSLNSDEQMVSQSCEHAEEQSLHNEPLKDDNFATEGLEGFFLRFSLCFLHLWDIDLELDKLLKEEMDVYKPNGFKIAAGIMGDRGSMTLMFPGLCVSLELWKSSSEYCAMRSLLIVSLAQRMIGLYHSTTVASSSLAAFYTRNFAEKVQDLKPPSLQLLVSFWQDPSEHVRMAARSLFHCAAPRAIPCPLYGQNTSRPGTPHSSVIVEENIHSEIVSWLESFDIHDWVSWIGGTNQDSIASRIIVAAALVVWYPSKVKSKLAELVADRLVKLVMSMNDRFSSTAAEILAEGMEGSWKSCLGPEISQLVGDVLFQIECLSGTPADSVKYSSSMTETICDSLVGILLPSLACADIVGFLNVIEDQIWSTSSDSPVHLVSLKTLARITRNSPKTLALYLDKVCFCYFTC
ncbi:hypothetical protein KSP40_PGU016421 [Platanthera guangdongensis]|uniref:WD repeat-containing protein 7 n=1 Tax=Platanthera guangdongensis TaxID=2320717 RepID=A0ABR2MHA7_9ASPA